MKLTPRNTLFTLLLVFAFALSACGPAATPEPTAAPVEVPPVEPAGASLTVSGLVNSELALNTADPVGLEVVKVTAEHPKSGPGEYEGVRLNAVLDKAGLQDGAGALVISASDGFTNEVPLADVQACADCLVGIADGKFNMVMPGLSSKSWVKDVVNIEVVEGSAPAPVAPANPNIILATTTSTQDSGLLDVLVPLFQDQTGYTVQTVAVGSGAAMQMGTDCNADVLLVHSPSAEVTFMDEGSGKERELVMHNDFIIVGPADDPAGIKGMGAADSFKAIAAAEAPFVARADKSGTSTKELGIWKAAELDPATTKPAWYIETGQGMGASMIIASEKGAYILTDRATYLANQDTLDLEILAEGEKALLNIYHVITVNPDKCTKNNYDGAVAFKDFMISPATQEVIGQFGTEEFGSPLFFPDAGKDEATLP